MARLVDDMIETMYDAPGTGLAANQVGVQRRVFVYDVGEGPQGGHQPADRRDGGRVDLRRGLPVGARAELADRPAQRVHLVGVDLDGNEISVEADELEGRVFQHELDHLDGVLLVERLDEDQRKEALRILRSPGPAAPGRRPRRPVAPQSDRRQHPWPGSPTSAPPRSPCPRCGPWWPPATRWWLVVTRPDRRRGRGGDLAQPGQGRRRRARPAGH